MSFFLFFSPYLRPRTINRSKQIDNNIIMFGMSQIHNWTLSDYPTTLCFAESIVLWWNGGILKGSFKWPYYLFHSSFFLFCHSVKEWSIPSGWHESKRILFIEWAVEDVSLWPSTSPKSKENYVSGISNQAPPLGSTGWRLKFKMCFESGKRLRRFLNFIQFP